MSDSPKPEAAPAAPAEGDKPPSKSASSPVKKTARPGKARASMPAGGSSKKNGSAGGSTSFSIGDIVLARLKGYPPWPARIADPESVPRAVQATRPGKSSYIYCCHFFPVGDYAWLNNREIQNLTPEAIKAYLAEGHRKGASGAKAGAKGLYEAYQTASDPTEWDEAQREYAASKAQEEAEQMEDVDELDQDGEDEVGASKKRKAPANAGGKKKAAKVEKKPRSDAPAKKAAASQPKSTQGKSKQPDSKAAVPENQAAADEDPLSSDPECVKVKDWRHKLQRAFLGKGLPGADEMTTYDDMFKSIEDYKDMTIEALQYSKIGKVMKKIAAMDNIPRNDEFKITDRAQKLMTEWQSFIDQNQKKEGANGDAKEAPASAEKDEANGE